MTSRALLEAIDYADPDRLRITLKAICAKSSIARDLVGTELLIDARGGNSDDEVPANACPDRAPGVMSISAITGSTNSTPNKRPRTRYATCGYCGKEFDTSINNDGACMWHHGQMVNEESGMFGDSDPNYPEAFLWSCCGKRGGEDGCRRTRHHARTQPPSKKARYKNGPPY